MMSHDDEPARPSELGELTAEQREWVIASEQLWQRAHRIAADHPGLDPGDVYHALRCLQLTPSQRLAAGLRRGRLRTHAR